MTEQKWLRQHALLSSVALLTALVMSACMARTIESEAMSPAGPSANGAADRTVQLPSGATLKVAADWTVTASPDGLTLEDPERRVKIELVEVDATPGLSAAIVMAWARRRQDFNRRELAASDSPAEKAGTCSAGPGTRPRPTKRAGRRPWRPKRARSPWSLSSTARWPRPSGGARRSR